MKNPNLLKTLCFAILIVCFSLSFVGCTDANSLASKTALDQEDPESNLNIGGTNDSKSDNGAPVVNLSASKTVVGTKSEVVLTAETLDPEGAQLEVIWDADAGNLTTTTASRAVWQSPEVGTLAVVTCMATDPAGKSARAEVQIEVLANSTYRLTIMADRSAIQTGRISAKDNSLYVPVSNAKIEMPALGLTGVTDSSGVVEFDINQNESVATGTYAQVTYLDWEVGYYASLKPSSGQNQIIDSLGFSPGYDGISVAVGRGDSFSMKRGAVEVTAIENTYGQIQPIAEVTVDAGSSQSLSARETGIALVNSVSSGNGEVNIRLSKNGYQSIDGYFIPVSLDGLTLVRARLEKTGKMSDSDAIISWTRPFNYENAFPVSGPFEIGFGQPMERETIFDELSLMIQNKESGSMIAFSGAEIERNFRVEWKGSNVLQLYPRQPLQGLTRYSLLISRWVARAADGRMLKNYDGMYGEFITEADNAPKMLSTSPVNGDIDVGRNGPFAIRFDRSMVPDSLYDNLLIEITNLNSNSQISVDGSSLKSHFAVSWKESNTLLELVPYRMLAANTPYLIKLKKCGLQSQSGKAAESFADLWGQFTTGGL
jgi:hypothetical protein